MILLWRLLKQNISRAQIFGFAIANLLGVIVLLVGLQFFSDVNSIFGGDNGLSKREFIVVSKRVSMLRSVFSSRASFNSDEIDDIASKPYIKGVGEFTAADFSVYASVSFGGEGISSDIFFESVPDSYVDVDIDDWAFVEGDEEIPIVIPRNYLNLYNFGFSQSRGLPQLTESAISKIAFDVNIIGARGSDIFKGRIVGFSNRLNTILVPESFMVWANNYYGAGGDSDATRLIIEVESRADDNLLAFMSAKGYDIEGDALGDGEMLYVAKVITAVVLSIGGIVTLLSLYILILSIYLLLEKSSSKIANLIAIGYSPWGIIKPLWVVVSLVNVAVILLAIILSCWLRVLYIDTLSAAFSSEFSSPVAIFVGGVVLYIVVMFTNLFIIKNKVNSIVG